MSYGYDLLMGLALLREQNRSQLKDWKGILTLVGQYNVLIDRPAVDEILTVTEATRIFDERKWLVGLMNYHGKILPLIEFKTLIDPKIPSGDYEGRQVLILVEKYGSIGLLVDGVKGVSDFWSDDDSIQLSKSPVSTLMQLQIYDGVQHIQVLDLKNLMQSIRLNMAINS